MKGYKEAEFRLTKGMGEIRLSLGAMFERVRELEQRIAILEAAQRTGSIQGLDGTVTVSCPPEWGGSVPLVEIDNA